MKNLSVEYVAGFFDGEGCITVVVNRTPGEKVKSGTPGKVYYKYSLCVQATQSETHREVLDRICEKWPDGHVYQQSTWRGRKKPTCVLRFNGKKSRKFLEDILPFLNIKNRQAELALEFIALPRTWNQEERLRISNEIMALNDSPSRHKGKPRADMAAQGWQREGIDNYDVSNDQS